MTTPAPSCHNCDAVMDWQPRGLDAWCPACEFAVRPGEPQRNYNSGEPCACAACAALASALEASPVLASTPPLFRYLGQAILALIAEGQRRRH